MALLLPIMVWVQGELWFCGTYDLEAGKGYNCMQELVCSACHIGGNGGL
jgi:hypothetical protein